MTLLDLAVSGLRHRRLRTLFLVLSVAIAIGVLTLTVSVLARIAAIGAIGASADEDLVYPVAREGRLPFSYIERLRKIPDTRPLWWAAYFQGTDGARFHYAVLGVNDDYPEYNRDGWFDVTPQTAAAWRSDRHGLVAGVEVMNRMGWHVGDEVTLTLLGSARVKGGPLRARVVGTATGYRSSNVIVHYEQLDEQFKLGAVLLIDVQCPHGQCASVAEVIDGTLANSSEPTETTPVSVHFQRMFRTASAIPDLLSKIGLLIVLVTGFITASTVSMSLSERRAELGTLRAIGFTRRRILALILTESVVLCLVGGVLGAVIPFVLLRTHGLQMGPWALENVTVSPLACAAGLASSALLGLFVAIVPALKASRQDVIKAMANN